jgi:hypothetical protein
MLPVRAVGWVFESVFIQNSLYLCVYTFLLALLATLDLYNVHTVSLYHWQLAMALGLACVSTALIYWAGWTWVRGPITFNEFRSEVEANSSQKLPEATQMIAPIRTLKSHLALNGDTGSREQYEQTRALALVSLAQSACLAAHFVLLLVKAAFLYDYTDDGDGGIRHYIDDLGFPTNRPLSFTMARKMDMLYAVQHAWVLAMAFGAVGLGLRRSVKAQPKK